MHAFRHADVMDPEYRHDGGSNRAHDPDGNLIGWFVYTDDERRNLELVDRDGVRLTVQRTAAGVVVGRVHCLERRPGLQAWRPPLDAVSARR